MLSQTVVELGALLEWDSRVLIAVHNEKTGIIARNIVVGARLLGQIRAVFNRASK